MIRSGYDEPDPNPDWVLRDEEFARIESRDFVQQAFQPISALVCRTDRGIWRRYGGEPFDKTQWELVAGMWDHEHCQVCHAHIEPGMTYWAARKNTVLCDMCYDRYLGMKP